MRYFLILAITITFIVGLFYLIYGGREKIKPERSFESFQKAYQDSVRKGLIVPDEIRIEREQKQAVDTALSNFLKANAETKLNFYDENSVNEIRKEILFYQLFAIQIGKGLKIKTLYKKAEKARLKLSKIQKRRLPILRKQWVAHLDEDAWINDGNFYCRGNGNTILLAVHHGFVLNRNMRDAMKAIEPLAIDLNFKRLEFKSYKESDEVTSWTLTTKKDSEIWP